MSGSTTPNQAAQKAVTPKKKARKGADEPDTREKLLDAVAALMTDRKSTEISLSEIALKSGVNSALVKYHFGNKAGLMLELLRSALGPKIEQMNHLAEMKIPAAEKLRIHISGIVGTYYKYPFVNRLIHSLLAESTEHAPIIRDEISKPVAQLQAKILSEGLAAGVFKPVNLVFLYIQITGSCDQFFFSRYQIEGIFGIEDIDDQMAADFSDYLFQSIMSGLTPDTDE